MSVRAIAFYLPQFHPIPENDEWWGKGFTEWTNVAKAKPLFRGHYQPRLPSDLGFYDLRVAEARMAQAELASKYGIHGFCYYHYWFNGKQVLERPMEEVWKSGVPDFPFCLCWANENWTRKWDGLDDHVLLKQSYGAEDDLAHIRALIPIFFDSRYIRADGRPILLVYRASQLPEPEKTTALWREEAQKAGLSGLFLARVEHFESDCGDPRKIGFDCGVEFQPHATLVGSRVERRKWWHREKLRTRERALTENYVYEYETLVSNALSAPVPAYPRIRCVCPGWDNSPRRNQGATIFINSTPQIYEGWLRRLVERQQARLHSSLPEANAVDSLIFVNAWNEWAEGAYLEPCQKWGRQYLEATRRALQTL